MALSQPSQAVRDAVTCLFELSRSATFDFPDLFARDLQNLFSCLNKAAETWPQEGEFDARLREIAASRIGSGLPGRLGTRSAHYVAVELAQELARWVWFFCDRQGFLKECLGEGRHEWNIVYHLTSSQCVESNWPKTRGAAVDWYSRNDIDAELLGDLVEIEADALKASETNDSKFAAIKGEGSESAWSPHVGGDGGQRELEEIAKQLRGRRQAIFRYLHRNPTGATFQEFQEAECENGYRLTRSKNCDSIASILRRMNTDLEFYGWSISASVVANLIKLEKLGEQKT